MKSPARIFTLPAASPALLAFLVLAAPACLRAEPPPGKNWKLVFEDDFDYPRARLDDTWVSDNGPNWHILCSRWPENVEVAGGILSLRNKKETRGGQDWTSGNIWTRKHYKYGYFECRYRYADATGVNNSFWIMTRGDVPAGVKRFELDINEGHFPDEVNCTTHDWSNIRVQPDGGKWHPVDSNAFPMGGVSTKGEPFVSVPLDAAVRMEKIRLSSDYFSYFHIRELAAFPLNSLGGYPVVNEKGRYVGLDKIKNLALGAKVSVSGRFAPAPKNEIDKRFEPRFAIDGKIGTSWVSQKIGPKWIELEFDGPQSVGCVQFVSGWFNGKEFVDALPSYKLEYFDGEKWVLLKERSLGKIYSTNPVQLSKTWNTYALLWDEKQLIFYFNGRELMRRENKIAHHQAPVFLSAAVTHWAHGVTDAVDGTSMDVDYVKIWQADEDGGGVFAPGETR